MAKMLINATMAEASRVLLAEPSGSISGVYIGAGTVTFMMTTPSALDRFAKEHGLRVQDGIALGMVKKVTVTAGVEGAVLEPATEEPVEAITVKLPEGYGPEHATTLIEKVTEVRGPGWVIDSVDEDAREAWMSRPAAK